MQMNKKELEAFAKEAAKGIKTPQDLNEFSLMLKKITVEAALNAEMEEHLGYEKHAKSLIKNNRNGKTSKRIKTEDGEFELETPRDRDGTFEPKLVKKHQSRFTSMDEKILWLYAQGMSTREIVQAFDEWYGADISPTLISRVTNAVIDQGLNGNRARSILFIRLFTLTVLWSKLGKINKFKVCRRFQTYLSDIQSVK